MAFFRDKTFLICGGDTRQLWLAALACSRGSAVRLFGFDTIDDIVAKTRHVAPCLLHKDLHDNLANAIKGCDYCILGLPASTDNRLLNTPLWSKNIELRELFALMQAEGSESGTIPALFGGMLSGTVRELADDYAIPAHDYFVREELAVLNSIPTAEGAIQLAMQETPYTIHGSRCLTLGYGRIGKRLASVVKSLGAESFVYSQRVDELAWARINGHNPVTDSDLLTIINQFRIIFNTIPAKILDHSRLEKTSPDVTIIDLASKPGGIDFAAAETLRRRTVWGLSLPGRFAPATAGGIILDTVINMIEGR